MSEELVAVWEAVRSLEDRQAAAEKQQTVFMNEVRGHLTRISEESREGRGDLIESNRAVVRELQSLRIHVDTSVAERSRDRDAYNRNVQGVASRLGTLETTVGELVKTVQSLTTELLRRRASEVPGASGA